MKKTIKFQIGLILLTHLLINTNIAYKLNVPKVLLPFHSSKLISFTLEATNENTDSNEEACFIWSTSRPDIVSITPIYDKSLSNQFKYKDDSGNLNDCSSKAIVSAVSKHSQRLTSIILARESKTDKLIRCDVIVDKINSIRIKHTTTQIFLEDSPECFTVEALDAEGNTFSSIDGLPFEWNIINDLNEQNSSLKDLDGSLDSRNVLKISKFIDSEYEVSESIRQLESIGFMGHKILIEGLKTGTANVQTKLIDPFYKETLKTPLVRLLVVANILLEPSYPIYLLIGSTVKYNILLIKQTSIEKIHLPSLQYYFESRNATTADLLDSDPSGSSIIGLSIGSTEIVLIDRNMKEDLLYPSHLSTESLASIDKTIIPPPTALVHVVYPDHLVFSIKNWRTSWILEVGRTYEVLIHIYTDKRQQVFPSDNFKIESFFEMDKFRVEHKSRNGSYNIITVIGRGSTQARASLIGTYSRNNKILPFDVIVRGEQDIELLDPIDLMPKLLIFALYLPFTGSSPGVYSYHFLNSQSTNVFEYQLSATGGSSSYYWQSKNTTIASVNNLGLIRTTATRIGHTSIVVTDARNMDIQAKSTVYVLEPVDLQLQACPVETQVGNKLYINIQMNTILEDQSSQSQNLVPIDDCSRLQFEVNIQDENLFKFVSIQSTYSIASTLSSSKRHSFKDACAVLVLEALGVGRTLLKLTTVTSTVTSPSQSSLDDQLKSTLVQLQSADLLIGSYSPLKSFKNQIILARGSSIQINLYDGPLLSSLASSLYTSSLFKSSNQVNSIDSTNYNSQIQVSDESLVEVTPIEHDYQPNRYSYRIKCLKSIKKQHAEHQIPNEESVSIKFSISHRKSLVNQCPLIFDYELRVKCARPASIHLNQLFVNNDENTSELAELLSGLKWKCPIKLSSNLVMAHLERPLFIQVLVKDAYNNIFDNFTSLGLDWHVDNKKLLEKASTGGSGGGETSLKSIEVLLSSDESALILLGESELSPNSQRVYYQSFLTKSKLGDTRLTAKLNLDEHKHDHSILSKSSYLTSTLDVHFVSDVQIKPDTITIFNHPSNIVPLALINGSGYYHAEIETIRTQLDEQSVISAQAKRLNQFKESNGNVLKINQITENSVVVSPLVNNGLTYLHIYDYCVPSGSLKSKFDSIQEQPSKRESFTWSPYATAKIQVAGINSILVNYEDDKLQVKNRIKIYVQISDATGNLIKTNYFSLMNLNAKLVNTPNADDSSSSSTQSTQFNQLEQYATIEVASLEEQKDYILSEEDKEYTAIYILNALQTGLVSVQFEARSDGYVELGKESTSKTAKTSEQTAKLIRSPLKEVLIYSALNVQPKYIEIIVGSYYQITTSGGPNTQDASIIYELDNPNPDDKKHKKSIVQVNSNGLIEAMNIGQIKISVKSVGNACVPFTEQSSSKNLASLLSSRCDSENKVQRVYSQDFLVVKVVSLHSIQIQVPIRSIKRGNQMPIYLLANEKTLNPLSFGSCNNLKFIWKVNDNQIGQLTHPLLQNEHQDLSSSNENEFEDSFQLRFQALQSGTVKVSVRVEFKDGQQTPLTDTIDILVFEQAFFNRLTFDYFIFKYPKLLQNSKLLSPTNTDLATQLSQQQQTILMTPGTQFQIKTNLDNTAVKIKYELAFYDSGVGFETSKPYNSPSSGSKYCNNNTITVSQDGMINVARLQFHELKNFKECIATLLVSLLVNDIQQPTQTATSQTKQQTLIYTIKVKPIVYSMIKLKRPNKSSLLKHRSNKNRLSLKNDGTQTQWFISFYDDLGDMFDVINTNTKYSLNRNDLVDLNNLNPNLFTRSASSRTNLASSSNGGLPNEDHSDNLSHGVSSESDKLAGGAGLKHTTPPFVLSSLSFLANSIESSFSIRTIKPGRFVMEVMPFSVNILQSKDYLVLNIEELNEAEKKDMDLKKDKIDANVGDLICLNEELDERVDESNQINDNSIWIAQKASIIRLLSTNVLEIQATYPTIGLCIDEGHTFLIKSNADQQQQVSSKTIEVNVNPVSRVKFLTRSTKPITNVQFVDREELSPQEKLLTSSSSNLVQFELYLSHLASRNCSENFEKLFAYRYLNNPSSLNDLIPFKCLASLYTNSGRRLGHLDKLIKTKILYLNQHWSCDVSFVQESYSLLYDLVSSNQENYFGAGDETRKADKANLNEPVFIRVLVESKQKNHHDLIDNLNSFHVYQAPFLPAFYVHTKHIELPIIRNTLYIKNLKSKNLKEFSLDEHFNLIIYATHQLESHFVLTTNCPSLIQVKPLLTTRNSGLTRKSNVDSGPIVKITYDIATSDELFDLNAYATILQEQNGNLYVQITNTLTQQVERVSIKFVFGFSSNTGFKTNCLTSSSTRSWCYNLYGWLFDFSPNQLISFFVMLSLTLITILCVLKLRSPGQQMADQMAINASAAVAAAAAANAYRQVSASVKDYSSFNPYRYFSTALDSSIGYLRSREPRMNNSIYSTGVSGNVSGNITGVNPNPLRRSPKKQPFSPRDDQNMPTSTPMYTRNQNVPVFSDTSIRPSLATSHRLSPVDRDTVRLFSVDSDVPNTTDIHDSNSFGFSRFEFSNSEHNDTSSSSRNQSQRPYSSHLSGYNNF